LSALLPKPIVEKKKAQGFIPGRKHSSDISPKSHVNEGESYLSFIKVKGE
jgi:hypothetical protein